MGWAELEGYEGGSRLGLAQHQPQASCPILPGQNAVLTFTVSDLEQTRTNLQKQGIKLVGDIEEVSGHVKMQTLQDSEGNYLQLVEILNEEQQPVSEHIGGCCGGH